MDTTGDPWGGRTLEWSTSSPPPEYNFAAVPEVSDRDPFWVAKQKGGMPVVSVPADDIVMPKNSPAGFLIGICAFVFSFAVIWNMWWIVAASVIAIIAIAIVRLSNDHNEYTIHI